ncbi:MAG: NADP-dependent phosphogluconate dehydrogenase, partial [Bacteroidota bacterium]
VSAKVNGDPCVAYLGKTSAGNYVKMVHNGIEYGLMQLIAEAYDLLKRVGGLSNEELHRTFSQWNSDKLRSFLVEITAAIFAQKDDLGAGDLVDSILDKAKQKGTGKWTSQNGMDLGIPVPTIDAAVSMRGISSFKKDRVATEKYLDLTLDVAKVNKTEFSNLVKDALYFAFVVTYAQGMNLLAEASEEYEYDLNMEEIAKIWRGGCIIRADLLEQMRQAYANNPKLKNLIVAPSFKEQLVETQAAMRRVLTTGIESGIPLLAFSTALSYFDANRTGRLPLNVVQAQRDYFGSHTYERLDRDGVFHTEW